MNLMDLLNEGEEKRPLSNEVKKHFLEIVSTYNKYQEMMDRKSDIAEIAETLGGITEAAKTLAIHEGDDWFDKHTIKRNMSELDKLGKAFDKCAVEAKSLDQRLNGLYEDMGHILSRYYKMGEISEEQMRERLGMNESVNEGKKRYYQQDRVGSAKYTISYHDGKKKHKDGSDFFDIQTFKNKKDLAKFINTLHKSGYVYGFNESVNEETHQVQLSPKGNHIVNIKEADDLNEEEMKLYELGCKVEQLMEKNCPTDASKWSYYKGQAKKKFDVYPSAYANGWAAKQYKAAGGSWKQCANESVNEDKKQIKDLVKTTKHEKLFYDVLSTMEKKYGKSNYGKWLDKSLKDFGENPSKYRTSADKEEKLFQLGSK